MRDLRFVEHDADIVASSACSIVWYSKESDSCTITEVAKEKHTIKLSANGDGQLKINKGYVNVDGFQDLYGSYTRMDSSYDRELSGQTYYAYDYNGWAYYITVDLSSYSKGDTFDCTIYYDDWGECDGSWDGTITVKKYDPSYVGPLQETINYSVGDNQEIEVDQEILSVSAVLDEDDENKTLTMIEIPDGVTSIGGYAFYKCSSLTTITIPDSVTSIESSAFYKCSGLTSVTIPDSVTSIGDYAFGYCTVLTSITIPDSVTSIGDCAFIGFPCEVYNSNIYAHCPTTATTYNISSTVTSIANHAFSDCTSLSSITIPDSVTSIGDSAFEKCSSLTSITIPNSVTSIGQWAFCDCSSLTSVTIPDSVTSIGDSAFEKCIYEA